MGKEWINWSGSVRFTPDEFVAPKNEEEIRQLILKALAEKKEIKIAGSGHSSVPLVKSNKILISQENLKGLIDYDKAEGRVTLRAGTNIEEAGKILTMLRMSMHVTGDVDFQLIGGAFGTGTHGSGKNLQNLSGMVVGARLIDGSGKVRDFSYEKDPDMINALRVSLGSLGIFSEFTIKAKPIQRMSRMEYCTHIDTCLEYLDELINNNLIFDFYWYPRSDLAKLRICNPIGEGMNDIKFAKKVEENEGWMYKILPQKRTLKFEEMEYAIPYEAGLECFKEVRKRIRQKHRQYVGWRVFFRTVAADDAYLSPFHKRDSVTIALLQNNVLEYKKYFDDMEPLLRDFGGRPHWGKKHTLKADQLKQLYPAWDNFLRIRKEMDPEGIFLNDYLKELFGI